MAANADFRYLIDTYVDWANAQKIPVIDGLAVDLRTVETAPWSRLGGNCRAAFVHLRERGDFIALQVIEIPANGKTEQTRHLYDEMFYVLSGHGSATVTLDGGRNQNFEFGPRALFSLPLNAPFHLSNMSGSEPLRLVSANDLPFMMNVFRNERFLFDSAYQFPKRAGKFGYSGEGDLLEMKPGSHMLETSFVADLGALPLPLWEARGAGSRNVNIVMSDSSMHAHASEMPAGTYKKAHRRAAGAHILTVSGSGYTLMWHQGDDSFERYDWKDGCAFTPPDGMLYQHFNSGDEPARYLAISLGSHRYPVLGSKVRNKNASEASINDGGIQIDYRDQAPRIHAMWLEELAKTGRKSLMGQYLDEKTIPQAG